MFLYQTANLESVLDTFSSIVVGCIFFNFDKYYSKNYVLFISMKEDLKVGYNKIWDFTRYKFFAVEILLHNCILKVDYTLELLSGNINFQRNKS